MSIDLLHRWHLEPEEAIRLQESLRHRLLLLWDGRPVYTLVGLDFNDTGESVQAAIAALEFLSFSLLESVTTRAVSSFSYIPGLLAFRPGPAILTAWEKLISPPNVLIIHGHRIAHPRRLGLASHMGLWLNLPCIGVAKRCLYDIMPKLANVWATGVSYWMKTILGALSAQHCARAQMHRQFMSHPDI